MPKTCWAKTALLAVTRGCRVVSEMRMRGTSKAFLGGGLRCGARRAGRTRIRAETRAGPGLRASSAPPPSPSRAYSKHPPPTLLVHGGRLRLGNEVKRTRDPGPPRGGVLRPGSHTQREPGLPGARRAHARPGESAGGRVRRDVTCGAFRDAIAPAFESWRPGPPPMLLCANPSPHLSSPALLSSPGQPPHPSLPLSAPAAPAAPTQAHCTAPPPFCVRACGAIKPCAELLLWRQRRRR